MASMHVQQGLNGSGASIWVHVAVCSRSLLTETKRGAARHAHEQNEDGVYGAVGNFFAVADGVRVCDPRKQAQRHGAQQKHKLEKSRIPKVTIVAADVIFWFARWLF